MNKVILKGRVGIEPEVKKFDNGGEIANTTLATNERWTDKNGDTQEKTTWHRLQFPKYMLKMVEYIKKGSEILVEGKIDNYQSKEGVWYTQIKVSNAEFCGGKQQSQEDRIEDSFKDREKPKSYGDDTPEAPATAEDEDDLPF